MLSPPKIYHFLGFLAVLTVCTRFQPEGNIGVVTTCPWWIFRHLMTRKEATSCQQRPFHRSLKPVTVPNEGGVGCSLGSNHHRARRSCLFSWIRSSQSS